jgi:hypothetical protein
MCYRVPGMCFFLINIYLLGFTVKKKLMQLINIVFFFFAEPAAAVFVEVCPLVSCLQHILILFCYREALHASARIAESKSSLLISNNSFKPSSTASKPAASASADASEVSNLFRSLVSNYISRYSIYVSNFLCGSAFYFILHDPQQD